MSQKTTPSLFKRLFSLEDKERALHTLGRKELLKELQDLQEYTTALASELSAQHERTNYALQVLTKFYDLVGKLVSLDMCSISTEALKEVCTTFTELYEIYPMVGLCLGPDRALIQVLFDRAGVEIEKDTPLSIYISGE